MQWTPVADFMISVRYMQIEHILFSCCETLYTLVDGRDVTLSPSDHEEAEDDVFILGASICMVCKLFG